MYKAKSTEDMTSPADREEVMVDDLRDRLRALDIRIARMRELHAGSTDALAHRLIKHSLVERAEIAAKLLAER